MWRMFGALALLGLGGLASLSLAGEEKGAGWEVLFNGKNTDGWKLRDAAITVRKIVDAEGKVIPGAKMGMVGKSKRIGIINAKGTEISGAKLVTEMVVNPSGWTVKGDELVCSKPHGGNDLLTEKKFTDFELHVEFQATSNSGVYLQGRYEIQIDDSYGRKPKRVEKDGKTVEEFDKHQCGALYSRIAPSKNMAKKAMEWQSYDVIFRAPRGKDGKVTQKARVTLVWNGTKVIDDAEIDGVTGGALDNKVLSPGPILLQGDHGKVAFRNIKIKPLTAKKE